MASKKTNLPQTPFIGTNDYSSTIEILIDGNVTGVSFAQVWKPKIFNPQEKTELKELVRLLGSESSIKMLDTIDDQLRDLCKSRHPHKELSSEEIDSWIEHHLNGSIKHLYGNWIYYPWNNFLIHILPEPEFIEQRTNRNKYKITQDEQDVLATKRIGVIGLSVGQSISTTLTLERGFKEIRLADFDTLELSNLNRIRTGLQNLSHPKVYITAREIAEIDPYLDVTCFPEGVTTENIESFIFDGGKLDVIVDECDSLDVKVLIREVAKKHGIPVVMDTSDRGMIDIERFDLEPNRPIFHGLIHDVDVNKLKSLTTEEKIPFVLGIVGVDTISTRLRASMIEIEKSISTWPQLASSVVGGGAAAADVVRRILLGHLNTSGRYFVDYESIIPNSENSSRELNQPSVKDYNDVKNAIENASHFDIKSTAPGSTILEDSVLHELMQHAISAPSGGNVQPWIWVYNKGILSLHLDRDQSSEYTDYKYNGSMAALGAAAENVSLAAQKKGLQVDITTFPDENNQTLAALFNFKPGPASENTSLGQYIFSRQTNRKLTKRTPIKVETLKILSKSVGDIEGAKLQFITEEKKLNQLGGLIGRGDRLRFLNAPYNRELFDELCFDLNGDACYEGIALSTLELSPVDQAGVSMCKDFETLELLRQWDLGYKLTQASQKAVSCSSAMGLLTLPKAESIDYFNGGRALQKLWLTATKLGLAFWPMTALPYLFARLNRGNGERLSEGMISELQQMQESYAKLFTLEETMSEVLLFRLAIAPVTDKRSLRKPVEDVFYKLD